MQNSLVVAYPKSGSINIACHLFNGIHKRSVVTWNAMIAGYVQNGLGNEAFKLFHEML